MRQFIKITSVIAVQYADKRKFSREIDKMLESLDVRAFYTFDDKGAHIRSNHFDKVDVFKYDWLCLDLDSDLLFSVTDKEFKKGYEETEAPIECDSEDGVTMALIEGMIATTRILKERDLGNDAILDALEDLSENSELSNLLNLTGKNNSDDN